ncbi:PREDICTED: serologically defined colon cancer antigen 3-like [Pterocles gutturalis]|uniref:serologically defined colon cancer antigen 3-like n=1 Tax=Pterocles gutturalis TaxID=240206 RepID=UPI00052911AE|nr:PREDICTED: serologically defined colon cancer antigen 3-like [Pterocles gutturalis]
MRVFPESQGLEDDDEDDDNTAHPQPQCKSHDSLSDSEVDNLGESMLFSLNPRHSYTVKDEEMNNRIYTDKLAKHALELEEEAQEFKEPFYNNMEMPDSLSEDEDHSWIRTYHLPVFQRVCMSQAAGVAPRGSCDSFRCSTGKHMGMDAFASWADARDPYLGYPEHSLGAEPHMLHEDAIRDRELPSLQLSHDVLREENTMLRKLIRSMQSSLESQACTVRRLERQVKAILAKGERETQELLSFVRKTEWSLQEELENSKMENESLRAGQTTDLGAVKNNIDIALQNLNKIITGANCYIRQLTHGAESLHFVAEVLQSTGKISEVEAKKEV